MSEVITKEPDIAQPLLFDTEETFEAWCDEDIRAEYLNGEVIMHSPAGSDHEDDVMWLGPLLRFFIDRNGLGRLFGSNLQIRLNAGMRRIADLAFVTKDRLEMIHPTYLDGAPDLVVEFVSQESTVRDWREKYWEYEAAGVKEYWVIDQRLKRMDLYILGEDQKYVAAQEQDGKLFSKVVPGFWIKPEWLWQKPLPSTYEIAREIGIL
jgi:Uma2 family endonuclease